MSVMPESADLASNRDKPPRGRGLSVGFWALMAFTAACLMAAGIVAIVYGVFGPRPSTSHAVASSPPAAPTGLLSAFAPAPAPPPPAAEPPAPDQRLAGLEARVSRLEANQSRALQAAAAALAAASLDDAAASPRPFINDLAAVERLMPGSPHVEALAPLAALGAPTRASLAAELADIAARASVAARAPANNASFMTQLAYAFSRVVSIRRVDAGGAGPDAVLAAAQRRAADGDIAGALGLIDTLPPGARAQMSDWRERARRRVDIDGHIGALRALALADLAAVSGSTP